MSQSPITVGVGAALMDLLLEEKDDFLNRMGAAKGGMTLVDAPAIQSAMQAASAPVKSAPGGSASNTLVGIGNLGGRARMIGRVGKDDLAEHFRAGLGRAGVEDRLRVSDAAGTGHVLSVVTPDAQRTMFTFLGASLELCPADIGDADVSDAALVHLEGYLLFNRPVVERVLELARKHGARVALDMGSFQVVEAAREYLDELFAQRRIDILMANEDEARAYTGLGDSESLEIFAGKVDTAVVKRGKEGALIAQGSSRLDVLAHVVDALDTTGAGDLWASGFLYGLNHGLTLESSANLASKIGSEVVQIMGAVIPSEGWNRVHSYREGLVRV
ncbi:MAG: adenosine kinase [Fibrobacteria bacterium]|nr:adenosine kinase [Fibrobacteria bacterium]